MQYASYAYPREDLADALHEFDFSGEGFVASDVLPDRPVQKEAAYISVVTRENLKRAVVVHKNGAAFNRINLALEDMSYVCKDYGLESVLTDRDRANYATDIDGESETVMQVKHHLLIEKEIRAKDLLFNTTTWAGATLFTDVSAAPWDAAASDAIAHVLAAKEKVRALTGVNPDSMLIGAKTMANLLGNTGIKARFPGALLLTELMIRQNMANIFGLANLYVGGKVYDSAAEGQTAVVADIWADDYALIFKRLTGSLASSGLGRNIIWTGMPQAEQVIQYREVQTAGDIFRIQEYAIEKVFDASFAHLLQVDA